MADTRKWIKISLDLPMHPKMLAVSVPARWLFMEMLCYCSEYMTDGVVPEVVAKRLATNTASDTLSGLQSIMLSKQLSKKASKMLSDLLNAGLTELAEHLLNELKSNGDPATLIYENGAYLIHDYLDHQASRKDIIALQERGRKMAQARWGKKTDTKSNASSNASSNAQSNASSNASSNAQSNAVSNAKSNTDKDKDIDNYPPTPNGVSPQGGKRATQKKPRKTSRLKPLPPDWAPNPTHARIALETGVNLDTEAEKFRDYLKASGKTYVDHDAAFRNWLRSPYRNNAGHAAPRYRTQADQIERMFQVAAASDAADQAAQDTAEIFTLPAPTGGDAA